MRSAFQRLRETANNATEDAYIYDYPFGTTQSLTNTLDARSNPNVAIMNYRSGTSANTTRFALTTAVQTYGNDTATQAAHNAAFIKLVGSWH